MQVLTKQAVADQDFESSLFQLAFEKLQNKLHNLLPYFVGFELVKKSDDGTKAIGVFGFKSSNGHIIFVPCFFANGKVKDIDLMYSKNNGQYYPLNEDFAQLFLRDDVTEVGNVSNNTKNDLMQDQIPIDYRDLVIPPRTGRQVIASSILDYVEDSDNVVKQAFWQLIEKDADFLEAVRRFYPDEEIAHAVVQTKTASAKVLNVEVKKLKDFKEEKELPDKSKADLVTRGYTIIDRRDKTQKSKVGVFDYTKKFTNPQEPGFYWYVTKAGLLRHGLVLQKPVHLFDGFYSSDTIVIDLDSKPAGTAYITDNVVVKDQIHVKDIDSLMKILADPASVKPSYDKYILVNNSLRCTIPFKVTQNYKDPHGVRRIVVEAADSHEVKPHTNYSTRQIGMNRFIEPSRAERRREVTLVFTKKPGETISHNGNTIYVPAGFRMLSISTGEPTPEWKEEYSSTPEGRKKHDALSRKMKERYRQGKPGSICDLTEFLNSKSIVPMTLHSNGSEYFATAKEAKKTYPNAIEAKIGMVIDFGLDEPDGNELIDSLIPGVVKEATIKIGVLGDQTLPLVDESPQTNIFGQPTYYGIPYEYIGSRSDGYTGDPTRQGLGVKPDVQGLEYEVNKATQLANAGQKEIFDTHAIATMAKYVDPSTKVTEYMPNFIDTLDKLGRLLFMIYWETGKFQDMYGYEDMPQLIELIKNVFKNLGDLVIFLKRKFPELSINSNDTSPTGQK